LRNARFTYIAELPGRSTVRAIVGEASVEGVSGARDTFFAAIDAKQARRPSAERCERRGRPCPHDRGAGGDRRDAFMEDA